MCSTYLSSSESTDICSLCNNEISEEYTLNHVKNLSQINTIKFISRARYHR